MMGVSMGELFNTLQVYLGSLYINDFNRFGRTWQVNVQADAKFREQKEDLNQIKVRNAAADHGAAGHNIHHPRHHRPGDDPTLQHVCLGRHQRRAGPRRQFRRGHQADARRGPAGPATIPCRPNGPSWRCCNSKPETRLLLVFVLAVVLVFLVLAAQYESWSLPLAVILVVPMCLLCSITGVLVAGMDVNIFTQVGFVVLVGLACKNAILIVEYAKAQREGGAAGDEATLAACRLRLRPIIMTSFAFILGVIPLVLSQGAGAEMRRTLGTAVFSGMLGVTLFGIFLTPVFYYVIQRLTGSPSRPTDSGE